MKCRSHNIPVRQAAFPRTGRLLKMSDVLRFLVTLKLHGSPICSEDFLMTEKKGPSVWGQDFFVSQLLVWKA